MLALIHHGGSLHTGQVPDPVPGPTEVLVAVHAAVLNNADLAGADGEVAGYEFSGIVDDVGAGADPALLGTAVMGTAPRSFAERVAVDSSHVTPVRAARGSPPRRRSRPDCSPSTGHCARPGSAPAPPCWSPPPPPASR